ncbi:diaminopimelate decarboxylase [Frankia sp. R43]|uniref:diaminopimelate decarboxylase n=1 Tax=Frankia sp. R43 TaxID=269536 RepID=UPI0006CA1A42|nr:diaminopimelate decarboxylase [Frankia sp. R43]KPM50500.1 diaminopimelate decarboxylase [Frankia sp. R43]
MLDLPISAAPLRALGLDRLPPAVIEHVRAWPGGGRQLGGGAESGVDAEPELSAYLYAPAVAERAAVDLRRHLPPWAQLYFAVKANSFPPVLDALLAGGRGVDGFEISSARELALATDALGRAGQPPQPQPQPPPQPLPAPLPRLVASGPGKSLSLLRALLDPAAGETSGTVDVVNVESPLELLRIDAVATRAGRRAAVALRVNPARVGLAGSLRMGGRPSAFGIEEREVPGAVELARSLPGIDLVGFHVHAVSGNLDAAAHLEYVRWCLDFAVRQAHEGRFDLRVVDVGGGLGVPFEPDRRGERPFDLDLFGDGLARLRPPTDVRVIFEPGRMLVADCGWYAAEVTDVKKVHGEAFAVLRGGINHFQLPTSWEIVHNFAVVPRESWPVGWPRPEVAAGPVTVVGELCTPEDTLARDVTVDRLRAGDVVVFPMAGAYGYEFAMHEFLGHPRAARIVLPPPAPDRSASDQSARDPSTPTG